jgi:hypothetical protein
MKDKKTVLLLIQELIGGRMKVSMTRGEGRAR